MLTIYPKEIKTAELHSYMLATIAPRPIAFASTMDKNGNPNLAPFSFFNAFGSNPPILIFSPARRVRDNTTKHTLENIREVDEVVINVVNYAMVYQTSLASVEYPKGVNEFIKAGFTPVASRKVKPYRVKESPVNFECKVKQVIETGTEGGAANLIVCEILVMHISEDILDENKKINPHKIDLVARMGGDWYCRASGAALFHVEKPNTKIGIGIDHLPAQIRESRILTGNNLGQLGNVEQIPSTDDAKSFVTSEEYKMLLSHLQTSAQKDFSNTHEIAKELLENGKVIEAWKVLVS